MDLIYFIILLGVLIFVHELGHFTWAKLFGVRVIKFSLGFGPKIAGFRRGETEYVIAAFPLGGYVKMLGEGPNEVISEEEEARSFQHQSLGRRLVIVLAGPAMNLAFPLLLFFLVFVGNNAEHPPIVGIVFPDRPADGLLLAGDVIRSVNGEETESFEEVTEIVAENPGRTLSIVVERQGQPLTVEITPVLTQVRRPPRELDLFDEVGRIGIAPAQPTAIVGIKSGNSPAKAAGMRTFDRVVSASGIAIDRWIDLEKAFQNNSGSLVLLTYLRPERIPNALGGLVEIEAYSPQIATVAPEPGNEPGIARAGMELADPYVSHVVVGSPEHRMGLLPGDRLVSLDGEQISTWAMFQTALKEGRDMEHQLTFRRDDRVFTRPFQLRHEHGVTEYGQPYDRYAIGARNWVPVVFAPSEESGFSPLRAIRKSFESTWEMVEVTAVSVVRLLQGRLSVRSIGGPLTVFDVAGEAAREGTSDYLRLMAFISVNLGLVNLLPIPLLDGGHLLIFLIEAVTRKRLSRRIRQYASIAGLIVLVLLMALAFKNDIDRHWPHLFSSEVQDTWSQ